MSTLAPTVDSLSEEQRYARFDALQSVRGMLAAQGAAAALTALYERHRARRH